MSSLSTSTFRPKRSGFNIDSSVFTSHLLHAAETPTLPFLSSVASFSLTTPNSSASVAICAVPTHEEAFLPEWITWHRLLGVERFHLFDNDPSRRMRRLLRPWIEEGSVVLYEIDYEDRTEVGTVYQQHVMRLCEKYVLPKVNWASHHDIDEFLLVDAPGWSPSLPTFVPPAPNADEPDVGRWTFPMHQRFEMLDDATCVPMLRLPFQNYGVKELGREELVVESQTVRERIPPDFHSYGKMFLHSGGKQGKAAWMGPHSCKSLPDSVILDAHGKEMRFDHGTYPYHGVPLPQEGLILHHYIQRSLADCYSKFHVLSTTPNDWRSRDGLKGCARNYVPTDAEISSPSSLAALKAEPQGEELVSRPESWQVIFTRDERARESWQARMTAAILREWRRRGKSTQEWFWEEGDQARDEKGELEEMQGVVQVRDVYMEVRGM
ncbi:hypothetical protein JCM11641_008364 [Rhodosporidiobolus odoratus]